MNIYSGSNAYRSSQEPRNAVSRFWSLTQRAVRLSNTTSKTPRVALKFILGPAVLTVSARLFSYVAYCEADVNNNIPVPATTKHTVPEFKWHILWEFVKPQLFALIGAVVVRLNHSTKMLWQCFLNVKWWVQYHVADLDVFPFQLAFGAAILNIKIPLMLGDLVNVVARYLREHTQNYVQEIRGPALKLLGLYGLQVSTKKLR